MTSSAVQYWLMKSEPDTYSIDDLARDGVTAWTGVRNYQARNFMRDQMRVGDWVFFYHSNSTPPGIAGLARVSSAPYADPTQFEKGGDYAEPRATREKPIWVLVDIAFERKFEKLISLDTLRADAALKEMLVLKKGQRLSVQPVEGVHARHLLARVG
ncbi:MAG: EVE domain-containing protein [Kiritimatiellae bacterium]|nr:EVE domain-containing protein [Kiritimatiellia bacterium]